MASIHVVFYEQSTGVKWDTDIAVPAGTKKADMLPPEGSEPWRRVVQQAVENIWGNRCLFKTSGRYDTGTVVKKTGSIETEPQSGIVKVSASVR